MLAKQILRRLASDAFRGFESIGVHVLPRSFYSPIADRRLLRKYPAAWRHRAQLHFRWELPSQAQWLEDTCKEYAGEAERLVPSLTQAGPGYGHIEALVLYCFMKSRRPPRVVEIGSGFSTEVMLAASQSIGTTITSIDPYSPLRDQHSLRVMRRPAQTVGVDIFETLGAGDLLFIDSTHTVKTGSELARLYLERIPSLRPGVFVHIHDVFLPYLYAPDILTWMWDWQETVLLAALLTGNPHLQVLCCQSALHHDAPEAIKALFPSYQPELLNEGIRRRSSGGHFPASIWLRTR
jgi:Methyltransferase domain